MNDSQFINKKILKDFSIYLRELSISSRSRSNYLSDIKHFFLYSPNLIDIRKEQIIVYVNILKSSGASTTVINRRLSSLRHFGNFQERDYMSGIRNIQVVTKKDMLEEFSKSLILEGLGDKTVNNYKSDAGQFINWLKKEGFDISQLEDWQIKNYFFAIKSDVSEATIKRKISSIRKLLEWYGSINQTESKGKEVQLNMEGRSKQAAVPGLIFIAVALLMIVQVFTREKIESPWPNAIAKNDVGEVAISGEAGQIGQNEGFDEAKLQVTVEGVSSQEVEDNEAALKLSAAKEAASEQKLIELETQLGKDAYGSNMIESGENKVLIHNSAVTPYSYIYITPTGSTGNQTIYIEEQGAGYFIAKVDKTLEKEAGFNWWLVNH